MKPSVLIVQPDIFVYGGAERQIVELANHLTERNYRVAIFAARIVPDFKRAILDARLVEAGSPQRLVEFARVFSHKFDIVNPHNHPAELMLHPLKTRSIWQCNEPPEKVLRGGQLDAEEVEMVRRSISTAVVISDYDRERFKAIYGFEPHVNYPGVNSEFYGAKTEPVDRYNLRESFVILESGYITWTKNQAKAVEILAEVKKTIPNAKLVLAGYDKDPYAAEVRKRAAELNLSNDIVMTGYVQRDEDMRDLFNLAHIHILPVHDQGGWAVSFQALLCGKPSIVSKHFVAANLFEKHSLGPVLEPNQFTDEILRIHGNYTQACDEAKQAAKWVTENLSWQRFGENYEKIISEVLAK